MWYSFLECRCRSTGGYYALMYGESIKELANSLISRCQVELDPWDEEDIDDFVLESYWELKDNSNPKPSDIEEFYIEISDANFSLSAPTQNLYEINPLLIEASHDHYELQPNIPETDEALEALSFEMMCMFNGLDAPKYLRIIDD